MSVVQEKFVPGVKLTKAGTVGTIAFFFFAIFISIVSCLLLIRIAVVLE